MASLSSEIKITYELRPCFVNHKKALFHKWSNNSELLLPSPMEGGHGGGISTWTLGIVEFEDGSVGRCSPGDIKFADNAINQYFFKESEG